MNQNSFMSLFQLPNDNIASLSYKTPELFELLIYIIIFMIQAANKANNISSLNLDMSRMKMSDRNQRRPLTSLSGLSRQVRGSSTGSSLSSLSPDDERPRPITSRPRPRPTNSITSRTTNSTTSSQRMNANNLSKLTNRPTKVIESSSKIQFATITIIIH